jgi:hypothetical protein
MRDEYHRLKVPKNDKMGTKHPFGKRDKIIPYKDDTSKEINKGPAVRPAGRFAGGSKTFGKGK